MKTQELDQLLASEARHFRRILSWLCALFLSGFLGLSAYLLLDQQQRQQEALSYQRSVLNSIASSLTHELQQVLPPAAGETYSTRSLWWIRDLAYRYAVGSACFLFLVDDTGRYLHHPNREWVLIGHQIQRHDTEALTRIGQQLLQNPGSGFYRLQEPQHLSWIFSEPVAETPYIAGLSCHADEILHIPYLKRIHALLFFLGSITLLLILLLLMHIERFQRIEFKRTSFLLSFTLLLNIGFIWYQTLHSPHYAPEASLLQSPTDFYRYRSAVSLDAGEDSDSLPASDPETADNDIQFIPTGLVIRSLEFETADTFKVSGYIWQRARRGESEVTWTPIFFPNAVSVTWGNSFGGHLNQSRIQGRSFELRLKQQLEHYAYPLNAENLEIRMIPEPAFTRRVALLPELESYRNIGTQMGLEPGFFIDGWRVMQSYFSYAFYEPPTDFGALSLSADNSSALPELRFNLDIQRRLWGSFLVELMALVTVLMLLFTVFVRTTHDQAHLYRPLDIFGPVIGLYFPLLLAHARVRQSMLSVEQLLYVDYLYMIVYLAIITVAMYFVFLSQREIFWLKFKRSIVPKALYWPWVLLQIWLVTVWIFL
ncbi:MAG: hypothetical protein IGS03_01905 [Candidatus Sericytochromatia bacterium]|nr:hypothetical protein [Candidatus Sericytochromatia bacterium]